MDEIDKLKSAWKHQDYSEHKVSTDEIYRMLHRKSSSYVKWIFIISIIEFVLINSIVLFRDIKKDLKFYHDIGIESIITAISIISYAVVFYFIYLFYKNYKTIKSDSTAKQLMESILKTRRTVKNYIYFNVFAIIISTVIIYYFVFSNENNLKLFIGLVNAPENIPPYVLLTSIIIMVLIIIILFLLFYRIIYGIFLRRLKKNYKDLESL